MKLVDYSKPYLISCLHHSQVYTYVIKRADAIKATKILTVNIGPVLKSEPTDKPITHYLAQEDGAEILLSVK